MHKEAGGNSTKERSGEDYLAELRRFIQLNGRAPRLSSKLVGTTEYKLRAKILLQEKKGRFSNKEKMQLTELLHQTGAGGEANAGGHCTALTIHNGRFQNTIEQWSECFSLN